MIGSKNISPVDMEAEVSRIKAAIDANPGAYKTSDPISTFFQSHDLTVPYGEDNDEDLIHWLAENRDPVIWYQVLNMSPDAAQAVMAIRWVLQQPECPNAFAVRYIQLMGGSYFYGKSDLKQRNQDDFEMLNIISEREAQAPFPTDTLSDDVGMDRAGLLADCEAAESKVLAQGEKPSLQIPRATIKAKPSGPSPVSKIYSADEQCIVCWAKNVF